MSYAAVARLLVIVVVSGFKHDQKNTFTHSSQRLWLDEQAPTVVALSPRMASLQASLLRREEAAVANEAFIDEPAAPPMSRRLQQRSLRQGKFTPPTTSAVIATTDGVAEIPSGGIAAPHVFLEVAQVPYARATTAAAAAVLATTTAAAAATTGMSKVPATTAAAPATNAKAATKEAATTTNAVTGTTEAATTTEPAAAGTGGESRKELSTWEWIKEHPALDVIFSILGFSVPLYACCRNWCDQGEEEDQPEDDRSAASSSARPQEPTPQILISSNSSNEVLDAALITHIESKVPRPCKHKCGYTSKKNEDYCCLPCDWLAHVWLAGCCHGPGCEKKLVEDAVADADAELEKCANKIQKWHRGNSVRKSLLETRKSINKGRQGQTLRFLEDYRKGVREPVQEEGARSK